MTRVANAAAFFAKSICPAVYVVAKTRCGLNTNACFTNEFGVAGSVAVTRASFSAISVCGMTAVGGRGPPVCRYGSGVI